MGKRSYAVVKEIMKNHLGRYPTRAELFEQCCYTSDGSPMSKAVQEAIVGSYVKLKSLVDISEVVATGIVKEIGGIIVNGRDLGPGICEVVIQSTHKMLMIVRCLFTLMIVFEKLEIAGEQLLLGLCRW